MNGNPRDDIGREGNQPASAGYGVDEACKKYEGADDDIGKQIHKNLPQMKYSLFYHRERK